MFSYNQHDKKGIYYGWVVVAASLIIFTLTWAIPSYFSLFFRPLQDTFGWSRGAVSWAATIQLLTFAITVVPAGWAVSRFDSRWVYAISGVLIGVALPLCSLVKEAWQLYLLYGIPVGVGLAICGPVVFSLTIRWFEEKRGLALGIASTGAGLGPLIGAPITNWLISSYNWRNAFIILGIFSGLAILVFSPLMKYPQRLPAVNVTHSPKQPKLQNGSLTLGQAIKTREMLLLAIAQIPMMTALRVIQLHIAPHALDIGVTGTSAALMVSIIGGASVIGRLTMGVAQDKWGPQKVMYLCLVIQGVSMLLLPLLKTDALLVSFTAVFGLAYGGDIPQVSALSALAFGAATVGVTYSFVSAVGNFAGALGPEIAGFVFDKTGTYMWVFIAVGISLFVSLFCISRLRLKKTK